MSSPTGGHIWEEAEGEFYSEAFLRDKTTTSSLVSLTTETDDLLESNGGNGNNGGNGHGGGGGGSGHGAHANSTASLLSKASSRYAPSAAPRSVPPKNPDVVNLQHQQPQVTLVTYFFDSP